MMTWGVVSDDVGSDDVGDNDDVCVLRDVKE